MKRRQYIILASILFCIGTTLLWGCTADLEDKSIQTDITPSDKIINSASDAVGGSIIVLFNESAESRLAECATRSGATRSGVAGVDAILDKVGGYAVEPIFVVTDKNREKVHSMGLHLWYELCFDKDSDIEAIATELAAVGEVMRVQYAQNAYRVNKPQQISISQEHISRSLSSTLNSQQDSPIPFNDTYRGYQWSLRNAGLYSYVSNAGYTNNLPSPITEADINVVPAWKLCKGDPSIVVAVMDEGIMYRHEDLVDNIWINKKEKNGTTGIDDDDNGYIDDIYGCNFVFLDGEISWDHDNDTGHGTHVAGIISAMNNNNKGISGIAGGSGKKDGVKLMSIQIFWGNGNANSANIAKGFQYAADHGAHIMQCSWGWEKGSPTNDNSYKSNFRVEAQAIDYFVKYGGTEDGPIDGGVVIFAAGNSGKNTPAYPAAYEPCVAVAAFTPALKPAYYSNHGVGTDIVAPGGELLYTNGAILSTLPAKFGDEACGLKYGLMQGTSQACPHVSGVAALGLSYAKKLGKRYTAKEFRSMLLSATNDIEPYLTGSVVASQYNINMDYPTYKGNLGAGYIDAYKLLLQIDGTPYTVVTQGRECEIELAPYFGDGVYNAELSKIEISDEDKELIGLGDCIYNGGKLVVTCSNNGVATFTVTLLIGGGSLEDGSKPYPTEVTKKFVVMSRKTTATNGGWL